MGYCDSEFLEKFYVIVGECSCNRNCLKEVGVVFIFSVVLVSLRIDLDSWKVVECVLYVIVLLKFDDDDKKLFVEWKFFFCFCMIFVLGFFSGKIMVVNLIYIFVGEDVWLKVIVGNYLGVIKGFVSVFREVGLCFKLMKIVLWCMFFFIFMKKNCIVVVDVGVVVVFIEFVF